MRVKTDIKAGTSRTPPEPTTPGGCNGGLIPSVGDSGGTLN